LPPKTMSFSWNSVFLGSIMALQSVSSEQSHRER
jgi:hypothetical protein